MTITVLTDQLTLNMANVDSQFIADLQREDDLGLVVRGHLHVEHQLIELVGACLPFSSRVDWNEISFRAKLEIAHACGLPEDRKKLILSLNSLRNEFAHRLDAKIRKSEVVDIYNALSSIMRETIKGAHIEMGLGAFPGPASLEPRDLLIHLFISARQATKAAADSLRPATSIRTKRGEAEKGTEGRRDGGIIRLNRGHE